MEMIVVGVDGSERSHDALRWAVDEARRRQAAVEAVFAWTFPYVVPVPGHLSDAKWLGQNADEYLEALLRDKLGEQPDVEVLRRVAEGPAARVLLEAAQGADMLVVGSRGRGGFAGLMLGSVSDQCAQHAPCLVVVVPGVSAEAPPKQRAMERIVVGMDGSEAAGTALRWALDEARLRNAAVDVVHAWQKPYLLTYVYMAVDPHPPDFERDAGALLERVVGDADTTGSLSAVESILVCDSASRALINTAKGADLLVVGSRGLGGFTGLRLGSASQQVVHHAPCPVVVVRPRDA